METILWIFCGETITNKGKRQKLKSKKNWKRKNEALCARSKLVETFVINAKWSVSVELPLCGSRLL